MKEVLYFGRDNLCIDEVLKNLKKFLKDDVQLNILKYGPGQVIEHLLKSNSKIVFFEFNEEDGLVNNFSEEIIQIRKLSCFSGVAVCGIVASLSDFYIYKPHLNNGITLGHIKGIEIGATIGMLVKIAYGINIDVFNYVAAKDLSYRISMYQECPVLFFSTESICIGTDILNTDMNEEANIKFDMIGDVVLEELFPLKTSSFPCAYPYMNTILLELPEESAWGGEEAVVLPVDTIETWVVNNQENIIVNKKQIMVLSYNLSLVKYVNELNKGDLDYIFLDNLAGEDEIRNSDYFSIVKPSIIFFDVEESSGLSLESLAVFISSMAFSGVQALIVVGNCPSSSIALQKVFGYENIVCTKNPLSEEVIGKCCQMYTGRETIEQTPLNLNFPKRGENTGYCEYHFDVDLNLFSENMIKFKSYTQLALFTIVKFDVPFKMSILIFSVENVESLQEDSFEYEGMIFGVDSIGEDTLRRLVNQIIDHPPKEFNLKTIDDLLNTNATKESDVELLKKKKVEFVKEHVKKVERRKVIKNCLSDEVLADRKNKRSKL
jgi:hypothetical protein